MLYLVVFVCTSALYTFPFSICIQQWEVIKCKIAKANMYKLRLASGIMQTRHVACPTSVSYSLDDHSTRCHAIFVCYNRGVKTLRTKALSRSRRAAAADKMVAPPPPTLAVRRAGAPPPPPFGRGAARRGTCPLPTVILHYM